MLILFFFFFITVGPQAQSFAKLNQFFDERGLITRPVETAKIFYELRKQLGSRFSKELLNYSKTSSEKMYYYGIFLLSDFYLKGRKPNNSLALLLFSRGITFLEKPESNSKGYDLLAFRVYAAIASSRLGLTKLAGLHKEVADGLTQMFGAGFPALLRPERKTFELIKY